MQLSLKRGPQMSQIEVVSFNVSDSDFSLKSQIAIDRGLSISHPGFIISGPLSQIKSNDLPTTGASRRLACESSDCVLYSRLGQYNSEPPSATRRSRTRLDEHSAIPIGDSTCAANDAEWGIDRRTQILKFSCHNRDDKREKYINGSASAWATGARRFEFAAPTAESPDTFPWLSKCHRHAIQFESPPLSDVVNPAAS